MGLDNDSFKLNFPLQRKKSRGSKKVSERPAETPVPEETVEKTAEPNNDALLSLPPQPKVKLSFMYTVGRTLSHNRLFFEVSVTN